jgi:hemoglobin
MTTNTDANTDALTATTAAATTTATLHDLLGGDAVRAVVDGLYDRLLADPVLAPYFRGTDMRAHRRHVARFVAAAAGGPAYRGPSIRDAHAGRGIGRGHFDATAAHLVAVLEAYAVPDELAAELLAAVAAVADDVVSPT